MSVWGIQYIIKSTSTLQNEDDGNEDDEMMMTRCLWFNLADIFQIALHMGEAGFWKKNGPITSIFEKGDFLTFLVMSFQYLVMTTLQSGHGISTEWGLFCSAPH